VSVLAGVFSRLSDRLRLREEQGWLIAELMMGALVLIIGGIAIYNGLDGASKTSGRNRNRSIAAYLAQQDQERMRSMDAAELSNGYTNSRLVTVDNVNYTVNSSAAYVNDTSGSISCTNSSSTAQYLKITSKVIDPAAKNAPVQDDSLLSPKPDDGNAAVQIVNRSGTTGVQGIAVGLQQPPGDTITTDTNGCSLFSFLDNFTNYTVAFSQPTYVDVNGNNAVSGPITVVPASVSVTQFQYDIAGLIHVSFDTQVGGTTSSTTGNAITLADSHMTQSPPLRTWNNSGNASTGFSDGALVSQLDGTQLFPFTDQYAAYAGDCTANDPSTYSATQIFAPVLGPGQTKSVTVREPAINIKTQKSGTTTSGAHVTITETDSGCTSSYVDTSNSTGALSHPGYPYGNYQVCVDYGSSFGHKATQNIANTSASGTSSTYTINVTSFSTSGTCP
jgi:hypothetical protein